MKFWSDSFKDGASIAGEFAFCVIDSDTHVRLSANKNPHLAWSELPAGVKSLVVLCHDRDAPSRGDDVNQEGKTVSADLPRVDFFHWTMIDLAPDTGAIAAGQFCSGVTAHGKPGPEIANGAGARHGLNDYTGWFAADPDMAGDYYGYDGPCPPWNDSVAHRYVFSLYALDLARLPLDGKFGGKQIGDAMRGHILAEAKIGGTYTLNPSLIPE